MGLSFAVLHEATQPERRVALTPDSVGKLVTGGHDIAVQAGAGDRAGFADAAYEAAGARIVPDAATALAGADVLVCVSEPSLELVHMVPEHTTIIGALSPLSLREPDAAPGVLSPLLQALTERRITSYELELMPRTSRAQAMDILSSQATIAGYRAVLLGALELDKLAPMLMTAAGTVAPARVLVLGAGVAGLQAIATARRLGAVVSAFDTRAAVREQVESLGASFVAIEQDDAEDEGGYARELTPEEQERQRELLAAEIAKSDLVITTAAVPGRPAPVLITEPSLEAMRAGSVVVDLAGATGGNCVIGTFGERVVHDGVTIIQPARAAADHPFHASQLYARNVLQFLPTLLDESGGALLDSPTDELALGTLLTKDGAVVHPRVRAHHELEELTEGTSA